MKRQKTKTTRTAKKVKATKRASAGGKAAASGGGYEHRTAAWLAVQVLGEYSVALSWDLPAYTSLATLFLQTDQPVDDILAVTSSGDRIFIQAKHTLSLGVTADSEFASVIHQFVRQYLTQPEASNDSPLKEAFDAARDKLVLATSSRSPSTVREHLRDLLDHIRGLTTSRRVKEAAHNQAEQGALAVVLKHLERSWKQISGHIPGEAEIQRMLMAAYVEIVDVDPGKQDERLAKTYLRSSILKDPNDANTAWDTLFHLCEQMAEGRSGADRLTFTHRLQNAGIEVLGPVSFRHDIERLQEHSRLTLNTHARLTEIRVGARVVKINRPAVRALLTAAEENSLVIVGEPGAGKTAALHELAVLLRNRDVIVLAADEIEATNFNLMRTEMGLEHDFFQILENWPGRQPGYIIIDALDKAGSERSEPLLLDLIEHVLQNGGRWHVIVSLRKFNLAHSPRLQNLLQGVPPTEFIDSDFNHLRHINIHPLTDDELAQIQSQAPSLSELLTSAPIALHDLVRNPFNLRLMGELIGSGIAAAQLTPIRSQIELLNRYWDERVNSELSEIVLARAAEVMVSTRTMHVDRAELSGLGSPETLTELLSAQLLVGQRYSTTARPNERRLTFAHHVLFDYAVARWLRSQTTHQIVTRLVQEPELIFVIRPSLSYHYQNLWLNDPQRVEFWDMVFLTLETPGFPAIAKLVGPSVSVESALTISDLEPIFAKRESGTAAEIAVADEALRFIVGALSPDFTSDARPILGQEAGPWCALAERISRLYTESGLYTLRLMLAHLIKNPENFTDEQRVLTGQAARQLLMWVWERPAYLNSRLFIRNAIESVCRTFGSDPAASAALLRRSFDRERLVQYGHEEIPAIADEAAHLLQFDPQFVEDLYVATFTYDEQSEAPTVISSSQILGMTSNRRQDYRGARWLLGEQYHHFLARSPLHAIRALLLALKTYAPFQPPNSLRSEPLPFDFDGRTAYYLADGSDIWDSGTHDRDDPVVMLRHFSRMLDSLITRAEFRQQVIDEVVTNNQAAVVWKRLLSIGASAPETFGLDIRPLAWAKPILIGRDTLDSALIYVGHIFPYLSESDRQRVEAAILAIAEDAPPSQSASAEYVRNLFLGRLPLDLVITPAARDILTALQAINSVPEPPQQFSVSTSDFWHEQESPPESEAAQHFRELVSPIQHFVSRFRDNAPSSDDIEEIFPALQSLRLALSTDSISPHVIEYGWGYVAEACKQIANGDTFTCADEIGAIVRTFLLEAAQRPLAPSISRQHLEIDSDIRYGTLNARAAAAAGLTMLVRQPGCANDPVWETLDRLSVDHDAAVRLQIAERLNALYGTTEDRMWMMIQRVASEEPDPIVVFALMAYPFRRLIGVAAERIVRLTEIIHARFTTGDQAENIRAVCSAVFTGRYVLDGDPVSYVSLLHWIASPASFTVELNRALLDLRDRFTLGPIHPPDAAADIIRGRAINLLHQIVSAIVNGWSIIRAAHPDGSTNLDAEELVRLKGLIQLANTSAQQIYFASGALNESRLGPQEGRILTLPEKQRFLRELGPIMDELASTGLSVPVHNLIETLESLFSADPADVLLRVGRMVQSGQTSGYQFESQAVRHIVIIVERYLAEQRLLLKDNADCQRVLREILDLFVNVGWPEAQRLAYRTHEIYH